MRDFIDIITEASIPDTDYGYWISQYAEIYPVGDHGHETFMRAVENCTSGDAILDGWIRVVVGGSVPQAEACFPVVKPRVKEKLVQIARYGGYESFIVDNYDGSGDYSINQYGMIQEFLRGIESLARKSIH